jgi:glycine/D-amino acid oxidase-like deaminating enzyme
VRSQERARGSIATLRAQPDIPDKVDVAIVGGGAVGLFTAVALAKRGLSVALFEKGRLGGEQSTRNWGWCRQFGRDSRELPLAAESMRLWRAMGQGDASPFRQCGIVYLARTEAQAERYETALAQLQPSPDIARPLTKAEASGLLGGNTGLWHSGVHLPSDGRADPDLTIAWLATAAEREGARIFSHCAVHGFETTAGRVSAIVTERGRVACDSLVVAAGAWSSTFCRRHGVTLPQIKVISSALVTEPVNAPTACVFGDGFAFGRQRDGSYLVGHGGAAELPFGPDLLRFSRHFLGGLRKEWRFVRSYARVRLNKVALCDWHDTLTSRIGTASPFVRRRILDPLPANGMLDEALQRLQEAFPVFAGARIRRRWAGAMDVTPDALPVISTAEGVSGLVIGTGFSGHGFGLSPGAGEALADLVTARDPSVDLAPFRLARFFDGSHSLPGMRF